MRVSIDGGIKHVNVPHGVRIIFKDLLVDVGSGEEDAELHINVTEEGVIMDVYSSLHGDNLATSSETAQEIVERLAME